MLIRTENPAVVLREWSDGDLDSLVRYANDRLVWRNLTDAFPHPYTPADAAEWFRRVNTPSVDVLLAIDVAGEAIGTVGYTARGGHEYHTAHFGYWIGRPHWGKGITTAAARALKAHAFAGDRFVRLEAPVYEWNPASMRVLEKCGFVRESVRRKSVLKDGQLIDEVIYAAIKDT